MHSQKALTLIVTTLHMALLIVAITYHFALSLTVTVRHKAIVSDYEQLHFMQFVLLSLITILHTTYHINTTD